MRSVEKTPEKDTFAKLYAIWVGGKPEAKNTIIKDSPKVAKYMDALLQWIDTNMRGGGNGKSK